MNDESPTPEQANRVSRAAFLNRLGLEHEDVDVPDMVDEHTHVAFCDRCNLEIGVDNQAALDQVIEHLDGGDSCDDSRGHNLFQTKP